ncbi:ATP-binding protein [Odoribacter lunatus]|uniref:ATP-binding protein n=1 Tax=Odoribacter lunatus TaxID=2941335 RepID=UPI00203B685B|nr:AAA family ATPase [Odoribacter lunatus]
MYQRHEYLVIKSRLEEPRKFIQVVTGPRQVGKTTVVKQVLQELNAPYQFFSADTVPETDGAWVSECWAVVRNLKESKGWDCMLLVIDEIQKVPNWWEVVKKEWEDDTFHNRNIKVLVVGNGRVLPEKDFSESPGECFEEIRMTHWNYLEMRDNFGFNLDQYLFYGGYPGAASIVCDETWYQQYIRSTVVEATIANDVPTDGPLCNPAQLRQTFELGATCSGQLLSPAKIQGALQDASMTTLAGYIQLLDAAGMLSGVQKYSISPTSGKSGIPKFQVYNNALKMIYSPCTFEQTIRDRKVWCHFLESGIGAYIICQAFVHRFEVFYWRERNEEVDFVLRKKGTVVAIVVKSDATKATTGLETFKRIFNPQTMLIIGDGGISAKEFLSMDMEKLF